VISLWSTPLPGVLLTLAAYLGFQALQRRAGGHPLLHPMPWSMLAIGLALHETHTPYETYFGSARILHFLLGPATVALAIPLVREWPRLKHLAWPVAAGLLAGNLSAIFSAVLLVKVLGGGRVLWLSMAPKSVTTPIAMGISERIGGLPSLTAVLVVLTGVLGALLGPWLLDRLRIQDPAIRGTAMGVAAHGIGTAVSAQESPEAGAFAGLAMALSGLLTALCLPWLLRWTGLS
jgi:predicted murein hydrolase (TIGR00659 family)